MAFFGNKRKDFSIQPPKQQVDGTPFYVTDSANIDFTLANLNLTANLTQLLPTSGTYGNATNIPVLQIDQWGRITGVTTVAISSGGTYTVNNGLTESPANNFQLGGTLIQNTDLTNSSFYLRFTQSAGKALELYSNDAEALLAQRANTSRNTVDTVARLVRRSTTNPLGIWTQSGFGAALDFDLMMSNGTTVTAGSIAARWNSPISPSESSFLTFSTRSAGVQTIQMGLYSTGILNLTAYGSGSITDILAYALGVNSSGDVIEYTPGTGTVTGVTATLPITSSGGTAPVISTSMATNKLIGRGTAGTGVMEEITLGTGLSLTGTTLNVTTTSGGILHGTTSGTDTYTVTITGATAYADGDAYLIRFAIGNTTSATLNINGQGAIPLYRNNDGPLLGGDVLAGGEMICIYNSTLNIFQCIGVSPNSLIAYVTNDDSVTITKGQPVYAFSGTGDRMTVKLAYNTGDSTSAQTVGLVLSTSIAANQKGLIMMQGLLDGLSNVKPVNGWADGSPVYLGTTAGSITPTKQYAPNHLVYLGFVTTASPGAAGRVYVRVQNGFEMAELHDVQAQTPANNDTLYYDNVTTPLKPQWKTASIPTILGYTPQEPITLTTTGSNGAATFVSNTLNIPNYNTSATSSAFYGDGFDGIVNLDGTNTYTAFISKVGSAYTLLRNIFPSSFTIAVGVTLNTNGYQITCNGTSTINGTMGSSGNNGGNAVFVNGNFSTAGAGGVSLKPLTTFTDQLLVPFTLTAGNGNNGGGGWGIAGGSIACTWYFYGALGGGGGAGRNAAGVLQPGSTVTITTGKFNPYSGFNLALNNAFGWISSTGSFISVPGGGGAAGMHQSGGWGGAGGGGGGCPFGVKLVSNTITISATGLIVSNGGNGGTGCVGSGFNWLPGCGGGGGGGGIVYLVTNDLTYTPNNRIQAKGGTGGAGGGPGVGTASIYTANPGSNGTDGYIHIYNTFTGTSVFYTGQY